MGYYELGIDLRGGRHRWHRRLELHSLRSFCKKLTGAVVPLRRAVQFKLGTSCYILPIQAFPMAACDGPFCFHFLWRYLDPKPELKRYLLCENHPLALRQTDAADFPGLVGTLRAGLQAY